jgi:hypothetical protein
LSENVTPPAQLVLVGDSTSSQDVGEKTHRFDWRKMTPAEVTTDRAVRDSRGFGHVADGESGDFS